jgi:hypothetical protein
MPAEGIIISFLILNHLHARLTEPGRTKEENFLSVPSHVARLCRTDSGRSKTFTIFSEKWLLNKSAGTTLLTGDKGVSAGRT